MLTRPKIGNNKKLVLILITMIAASILGSTNLSAVSNKGPDFIKSRFPNEQEYYLKNGTDVVVKNMTLYVYCSKPSATDCQTGASSWTIRNNCIHTSITKMCAGTYPEYNNAKTWTLIPDLGMYRTTYYVQLDGSLFSGFQVSFTSGYYIGHSGGVAVKHAGFGYEGENGASNWTIKFRTPCSVTSSETKTVKVYDMDNYIAGQTPTCSAQGNPFQCVYSNPMTVNLYDVTSGSTVSSAWSGSQASHGTYQITHNFEPNHRYELRMNNVNLDNVIEYDIPYEDVYDSVSCISWDISLNTNINQTTARPGDTVTWTHQAKQNGPSNTDAASNFSVNHANTTSGYTWTSTVSGTTNFASGRGIDANYVTVRTETRTIAHDDVGKKLCSRLQATRVSSANTNAGNSASKCVDVAYNYTIEPITEIGAAGGGKSGSVNIGEDVTFRNYVQNPASSTTRNKALDTWRAFTFVVPHGGTVPGSAVTVASWSSGIDNTIAMVNNAYYGGTAVATDYQFQANISDSGNCQDYNSNIIVDPNTLGQVLSNTLCNTKPINTDSLHLGLGDSICMAFYIREFSTAAADVGKHRFSQPACYVILKSPQIQLKGADSKSGAVQFGQTPLTGDQYKGGFSGHHSSNPVRGSWSQYGLLADGAITNFGASGYTLGNETNRSKACKLLFANTRTGGSACTGDATERYGNLEAKRTITIPAIAELSATELAQQVADNKMKGPLGGAGPYYDLNLNSLDSGKYYLTSKTRITASQLSKNKHLILVARDPNTISIAGDITINRGDSYTSLSEIPSLTIIADNINVTGPVTALYGTYIARDRFSTCTYQYRFQGVGGATADAYATSSGNTSIALAGLSNDTSTGAGLCQNQLTVTGAIISKNRPDFHRTHGADKNDPTNPSEIFHYTPNLYLTPYNLTQTGPKPHWTLTDLKQLPARL